MSRTLIDPDDNDFFFRTILQTKLPGDVFLLRSIHTFNNLESLCETLEKEFGKSKSFEQWELEANNLRQYRNESIEKYVERTKQLNTELILAISNYPDPIARAGLKIFATNKLIDNFLGGLDRNVSQHLLAQKFHSLDDAMESAVRFITRSQYHSERVQISQSYHSHRTMCNYCKKLGHVEAECRTKAFHTQNRRSQTQSHRYSDFTDRVTYELTFQRANINPYRDRHE